MTAYTPQPRVLKPGPPLESGDDISVYQEVLHALGFLDQPYRAGEYAENTWKAVEAFGKAHGIEPTNTLGPRVHNLLSKHMTPGQGFRLAMELGALQGGKGHRIAQAARWYMPYWLNYVDTRPLPVVLAPLIPEKSDCSFFANLCLQDAGFPSPDPQGNTHSLVEHGQPVTVENIRPGDFVFVDGPAGVNSHMFVAWTTYQGGAGTGISHGMPGVNFERYDFYPIYAVRRMVT